MSEGEDLDQFREAVSRDLHELAALHDRELDRETLERLRADEGRFLRLGLVSERGRDALVLFEQGVMALPPAVDSATMDALSVDFADIYLTYGLRAAPCESVWLDEDNLVMQEPMFEVRELYRRHGLSVPDWRRRPDDHLVHELQFLAHLVGSGSDENLREAAAFLDGHLLLWLPDFAARVVQRCATPLYAGIAALTAAYVDELRDLLAQILEAPRPTPEEMEARRKPRASPELLESAFVPGSAPTW
jgi:TorA maturation chaperone TorD